MLPMKRPPSRLASISFALLALMLLRVPRAQAGTLIFPQPPATWDQHCDDGLSHPAEAVLNSAGCATHADFLGGHFVSASGGTQYVSAPNMGYGCGDTLSVSFGGYLRAGLATSFAATVGNFLSGTEPYHYAVDMRVADIDPNTGFERDKTTRFPLAANATLSLSGNGYGISSVSLTPLCLDCGVSAPPPIAITSMSATQPVYPSVDLRVDRDAGGSYAAVVSYAFPGASDPSARALSLSLLAAGQDPALHWDAAAPLPQSGVWVQPLGTFSTDRTLLATAFACDGGAQATASISGCSQCNGPPTSVGPPVRLFDGAMTYTETDPLPSTLGLEFRREYSTADRTDGRFGLGWSSVFDASATPSDTTNGTVIVVDEDRTRAAFTLITTGEWLQIWPKGGASGTLTGSEASGYTYRDAGGTIVRTFGASHRLTRIQDLRRGRAVSLVYDAAGNPLRIFDERGQWSCTVTTSGSHVASISVDGRPDLSWTYAYDGALLTSVTPAGAPAWRTYEYLSSRMTAARDAAGTLIEGHDYDAAGRAISWTDASGDVTGIQYAASDSNGIAATTVTRADNSQASYEQAFSAGAAVTRKTDGGCSSCGAGDATAVYDANGNVIRLQNARGYVTQSAYDATGRHLQQTTTAMVPAGCDPETDPAHCRLSSDALAAASLATTAASQTTSYRYDDPNWPANATRISRPSVFPAAPPAVETFVFDAATGQTLAHTMSGAVDSAGTQESHATTTTLYGAAEGAAFDPGGAFQAAWLALAQPQGEKKSVDGPRTDVADVTTFVYYPIDAAVPGSWRGHVAAARDALGHLTRYQDYDVFGNAATLIDPNGVVTRRTFDALGRPLTETIAGVAGCDTAADPLCATDLTTTRTYAPASGPLASEQRPAGNVTSYIYDARGRVQMLTRGTASQGLERIETSYDLTTGKKSSESLRALQNNAWVTTKSESYAYTSDGHLAAVTHADNTRQLYTYLADGTLAAVQDENHNAPNTVYGYDPANRLTTVTQTLASAPGGQIVTRYGYDMQGNLTSISDPNGNVTSYVYDDFGRMQRQTSPVTGATTYAYDAAGNLLTTTDANGAATTRTYDALNRVLTSSSTRGGTTETVAWTYDDATAGSFGIGRLATMTDPTGATSYRYERRGFPRTELKTIASGSYTTRYAYDANGNRSSIVYPSGLAAAYTFDFADRPYSLAAGSAPVVSSASYLPFGPVTSLTFGNGTARTMGYDARYRPLENKLAGPGGTIADYAYASDNAGNITQIHDATNAAYNRDFAYDDLNRLTAANTGASLWGTGTYSYDAMGNMLASSLGSWKTTTSSLAGTTPKLSAVVQNGTSRSVAYDSAGNETAVGTSAFGYSPRNQLVSADAAAYVYDGRGLLTISTVSIVTMNVSPAAVTGGAAATGTLTLGTAAAADTVVALSSSNPGAASVPATVTVPAGNTTASFSIMTSPVAADAAVTIAATLNQYTTTASLSVLSPQLASLAVSPAVVVGGGTATGSVTLTGAAAAAVPVALSSDSAAATVPASVTVSAGSSSATFSVATAAGTVNTTAHLTATLNGTTKTAALLIGPPELNALTIAPSSAVNGASFTGTVTLTSAATSAMTILLSSTDGQVVLPAQVVVSSGSSSANFSIFSRLAGNGAATETITATHGAVTRQATITITPPSLTSFVLDAATIVGGTAPLTGTATLNGAAPTNGWQLPVSSTNTTTIPAPAPVAISNPASSGSTTVLTRPVLANTAVTVSASDPNGASRSAAVTVQPVAVTLKTFTLSSTSTTAPATLTGTVTLTAAAPAAGVEVDLSVDPPYNVIWMPPFVRVPAGATSATFQLYTYICDYSTPSGSFTCTYPTLSVSATHSATKKTVALTVKQPSTRSVYLMPFSGFPTNVPNPLALTAGTTGSATVTLSEAAPSKGTAVTLSSSNTSVTTVPASVTVPAGSWSTTFPITIPSRTAPATATITATCSNNSQQLAVVAAPPNVPTLVSLGVENGNTSSTAIVTLSGPAPAGGAVVILAGSRDNVVNVPPSVTVPAGATSARAPLITLPYLGAQRGTIVTATYNGVSLWSVATENAQSAMLKHPGAPQCASLAVAPCLPSLAVAPTAAGDTTGYTLYTPELQLLAETAVTAAAAKPVAYSYLWFAGIPVASIEAATSTTRWYLTDHLGTPLLLTDASAAVVWRAEYDPYGSVYAFRTGPTLHQPLRFPGQVAQDGVDAYYNVFRWYRSGWGRYTQADPIGLAGGMHAYRYAGDEPIAYADPLGLVTWSKSAPVYHGAQQDPVYFACHDWAALGCTNPVVHTSCKCQCSSGRFMPSVELSMNITVWARNDDPRIPLSQILNEEQKHVWYYDTMFRWAVKRGERLEARRFQSKVDCDKGCSDFYAATYKDFTSNWVHQNNPHPSP